MKWVHPGDSHPEREILSLCVFSEVIRQDMYGMRDFARRHGEQDVRAVVDVGANVGYFSVLASCLFPSAQRIAIEPAELTHELLVENVNGWGVKCIKAAIGNGSGASLVADNRTCGSDRFVPDVNGGYTTRRLSEILKAERVPKNGLVMKVDCEGGERWMVDDPELNEWMAGCIYFAAEFHESESNPKSEWVAWMSRMFAGCPIRETFLAHDVTGMMLYAYVIEREHRQNDSHAGAVRPDDAADLCLGERLVEMAALGRLPAVDEAFRHILAAGGKVLAPTGGVLKADSSRDYRKLLYDGRRVDVGRLVDLEFVDSPREALSVEAAGQTVELLPIEEATVGALALWHLAGYFPRGPGRWRRRIGARRWKALAPRRGEVLVWWRRWLERLSPEQLARVEGLLECSAWTMMGNAFGGNWQHDLSPDCYRRQMERTSCQQERLAIWVKLAGALVCGGDYAGALDACRQAEQGDGRHAGLFSELALWKARALRRMRRLREAGEAGFFSAQFAVAGLNSGAALRAGLFLAKVHLQRLNLMGLLRLARLFAWAACHQITPARYLRSVKRRSRRTHAAPMECVAPPAPESVRRIAVCRLDGLGDLIMTIPALRLLRAHYPHAAIDMFVARPWGEAARWIGVARNVHEVDVRFRDPEAGLANPPTCDGYDLSVDFVSHDRTYQDQLMNAVGATFRLGYDMPAHLLRCNLRVAMPPVRVHAADLCVSLLRGAGVEPPPGFQAVPDLDKGMFPPDEAVLGPTASLFRDGPVIGLHPGAGWPLRKWYPECLAEVADRLSGTWGCRLLLTGGPGDADMVDRIGSAMTSRAERFICRHLTQLATVLANVRMLLCHDSGPMHLAASMGTPLVVIWGPGDYVQNAPRGSKAAVVRHQPLCAPCCQEGQPRRCGMGYLWREMKCLSPITVQEVTATAERMLASLS